MKNMNLQEIKNEKRKKVIETYEESFCEYVEKLSKKEKFL